MPRLPFLLGVLFLAVAVGCAMAPPGTQIPVTDAKQIVGIWTGDVVTARGGTIPFRLVVRELTFRLAAGDKVGVVGRNGAGKTSLLRVLAGEELPAGGTVTRRGRVGYLRQDPRQHRADDDTMALEHILAARDLVELARLMEKARIGMAVRSTSRMTIA